METTTRIYRLCGYLLCVLLIQALPMSATALTKDPSTMYGRTTNAQPDKVAGGWWINLGVTGARGRIMPESPAVMEVMYVFERTPASGKLQKGDQIVGVNGKPFENHTFGYGRSKFGYEGPMMAIGLALETAQSGDGKLTFDLKRGGKGLSVEINVGTKYGGFSDTFPSDCDKSERMLGEMLTYLTRRQGSNGLWSGRPHINAFAALALLASPNKEHRAAAQRAAKAMAGQTGPKVTGGLGNWRYTLYGIVLGEYYLATRESWVLPELVEVRDALLDAQNINGPKRLNGWGHNPGFEGYGPMSITTAQALTALGLMMDCGIDVDRERYDAGFAFLARATNDIGYVWYADGSRKGYADMGRTGMSAIAHAVSPVGGEEYVKYALRSANCIGLHPEPFADTHASPILGMGWTAVGASISPDAFRSLMDYHVAYFNLAHCPDGTFYYQPNRDGNQQDFAADPRLSATSAMALAFSVRFQSLRMMGARIQIEGVSKPDLPPGLKQVYELIEEHELAKAHGELMAIRITLQEADEADAAQAEKDLAVTDAMKAYIEKLLEPVLASIEEKMTGPDVLDVEETVDQYRETWHGVPAFDELDQRVRDWLREPEQREARRTGISYQRLVESVQRRPSEFNIRKLESFAKRYDGSYYGQQAAKLAEQLSTVPEEERKAYFEKNEDR